MIISQDVLYAGVNDNDISLFEGQFPVTEGMAYNSYVILDEKIAVVDSVDESFGDLWIKKVEEILKGRIPEYLIVHHVEPDHSANIMKLAEKYPKAKIVASAMAFMVLKNYFGTDFSDRRVVVKEGDTLSLGKHNLKFIAGTNIHWPEVLFSYDETDKILFSADAFGKFGAVNGKINFEDWIDEARRYYFGIVGKFGSFVQTALNKISALDVKIICPLHGPVISERIADYVNLYDIWSKYGVESEGVLIPYTTVYGHTKRAVELFANKLNEAGCQNVEIIDLTRDDVYKAISAAFKYGKIVFATTTYCTEVFPAMREFIEALKERNFIDRKRVLGSGCRKKNERNVHRVRKYFFCRNHHNCKR